MIILVDLLFGLLIIDLRLFLLLIHDDFGVVDGLVVLSLVDLARIVLILLLGLLRLDVVLVFNGHGFMIRVSPLHIILLLILIMCVAVVLLRVLLIY